MVSWSICTADLGCTLVASAYCALIPAPDGTKNAPFTITSPSVLQFQPLHSLSSVSTRFVTCHCNRTKPSLHQQNHLTRRPRDYNIPPESIYSFQTGVKQKKHSGQAHDIIITIICNSSFPFPRTEKKKSFFEEG